MQDSDGLLGLPTGRELEVHWKDRLIHALREACRVQAVVTIALGQNRKVFLGWLVNLKKTSVTGSTKPRKNSSCGSIKVG
jgi:hypothetical protein